MDVLDVMKQRTSTRAYLDKPIDRATVEAILDAARLSAASGKSIFFQ